MQTQLSLLSDAAVELVRDAEGGIVYHPGCLAWAEQKALFHALYRAVAWRSEERPMYDRIVAVPRQMARAALNDPARPACLAPLLGVARAVAPAPYTHAGFNLYRDGQDSVAMHNDRLHDLAQGRPITLVSLGAARDMLIKPKRGGAALRVRLEPGSVLVMSHASQRTHEHGIPKTAEAAGPRISVAFRVRPG